jgi:hypothetical protein
VDVRRGFVALVVLVSATALTFAIYPNGQFSHGGRLPAWLIAASVVTTVAVAAGVLWWLARTVGWSAPPFRRGTADAFIALLAIAAASHGAGIGVELLLGAPALWLVIPTATIGYGLFIVWFQKRYGTDRYATGDIEA